MGSLSLLQGIFPLQGLNPGLPHWRQILYQLSHQRSPGILEWVAYPFSQGASQSRNWTRVSCTAAGLFTDWAIREAPPPLGLWKPQMAAELAKAPPGWKWKWKVKVKSFSCAWLLTTPSTGTYQAPQSMGFSRQEYWSGLPFPTPRDLPNPGIKPESPALQTDTLPSEPIGKPKCGLIC